MSEKITYIEELRNKREEFKVAKENREEDVEAEFNGEVIEFEKAVKALSRETEGLRLEDLGDLCKETLAKLGEYLRGPAMAVLLTLEGGAIVGDLIRGQNPSGKLEFTAFTVGLATIIAGINTLKKRYFSKNEVLREPT